MVLQSAVDETATGNAGGVRVRPQPTPADDHLWYNQFRPDDPTGATNGAPVDVGFYGGDASKGGASTDIKVTYDFVNPADGSAGLIAANNIILTAANPKPTDAVVNVRAITELSGGNFPAPASDDSASHRRPDQWLYYGDGRDRRPEGRPHHVDGGRRDAVFAGAHHRCAERRRLRGGRRRRRGQHHINRRRQQHRRHGGAGRHRHARQLPRN